jgi:probable HAF family extracellular repeat protein
MSRVARADRGGRCAWAVLAALSAVLASTATADPSFQGLGDLPGGDFHSAAYAVTADGSTVVGRAYAGSGQQPFRWTQQDGMVGLPAIPGGSAQDVSADGSVVVGYQVSGPWSQSVRWNQAGEMAGLGDLPSGWWFSHAWGVSADGSIVAGYGSMQAYRWTQETGMVPLGHLRDTSIWTSALAISADGAVIVGGDYSSHPLLYEAFRWTAETGLVGLGDLPGGPFMSAANDVTPDGSVIVGFGGVPSGVQAFRWTETEGMVGLVGDGVLSSNGRAVSADGSLVVGYADWGSGDRAFVWDAANGIRDLGNVLVNDYRLDLTGWTLVEAIGISADGKVIVGYGTNPDGNTEAWMADLHGGVIPEPLSMAFMASAFVGVVAWRRRHRRGR